MGRTHSGCRRFEFATRRVARWMLVDLGSVRVRLVRESGPRVPRPQVVQLPPFAEATAQHRACPPSLKSTASLRRVSVNQSDSSIFGISCELRWLRLLAVLVRFECSAGRTVKNSRRRQRRKGKPLRYCCASFALFSRVLCSRDAASKSRMPTSSRRGVIGNVAGAMGTGFSIAHPPPATNPYK